MSITFRIIPWKCRCTALWNRNVSKIE